MWVPTQDEAILMFARSLKARRGIAASKLARKTAKTLQDEGDLEGHKIWNAVADAVDRPPAGHSCIKPSRPTVSKPVKLVSKCTRGHMRGWTMRIEKGISHHQMMR
jgi:hypothetical protein